MSDDILFRPFTLKTLTLPNRIVMAPMTRSMAEGGIPGSVNAEYYRRRAEGGVGLILTEGTVIDRPASRNMAGIPFSTARKHWQAGRRSPAPFMLPVGILAHSSGTPVQPVAATGSPMRRLKALRAWSGPENHAVWR